MANFDFVVKHGLQVNGNFTANSTKIALGANVSANTSALTIGNTTVNTSINATSFSGTSNNSLYLGGTAANGYQTTAGLAANVAALASNSATFGTTISAAVSNTALSTSQYVHRALYGTRAENLIAGGGTMSYTGTQVAWSSRFSVISGSKGTSTPAGINYYDIPCPTTGSIDVVGVGTVTANATGVPLSSWEALYYDLGTGTNGNAASFHIINYSTTTANYQIPSTWVLLCAQNGDYNSVHFSSGKTRLFSGRTFDAAVYDSAVVPLANNATNLGGTAAAGYQTTAGLTANVATRTSNNSLFLGGTAASGYQTTAGLNANIAGYISTYTGTVAANNIVVGNSTVNVSINSTSFSGTANNATSLAGTLGTAFLTIAGAPSNTAAYLPVYTGVVNGSSHTAGSFGSAGGGSVANSTAVAVGNSVVSVTIRTSDIIVGNSTVNVSVNSTSFSGTSNNTTNLGGVAASSYTNTTGSYTISGVHTYTANVVLSNAAAAVIANGSPGTAGQFLTSNGTSVYWSTRDTAFGSNTQIQFNDSGVANGSAALTFSKTTNNISVSNSATISGSLGIGTAASGSAGDIRATGDITAFFSSDRALKDNIKPIPGALAKIHSIRGVTFDWTDAYIKSRGGDDGYFVRKHDVGVIAQDIQAVLPEAVVKRPDGTLAVKYDRIIPLLIEAVRDLSYQLDQVKKGLP